MDILQNRKAGMWISVVAIALQIAILFIGKTEWSLVTKYLGIAAGIFAGIFAFVYLYKGATKDDAMWMKMFCYLLMASLLLSFVRNIETGRSTLNSFCTFFMAVIVGYLAFIKDLGKVNSLILIAALLVLEVLTIVSVIGSGSGTAVKIIGSVASSLLVLVLLCCTYAKYVDKRLRKGKEE